MAVAGDNRLPGHGSRGGLGNRAFVVEAVLGVECPRLLTDRFVESRRRRGREAPRPDRPDRASLAPGGPDSCNSTGGVANKRQVRFRTARATRSSLSAVADPAHVLVNPANHRVLYTDPELLPEATLRRRTWTPEPAMSPRLLLVGPARMIGSLG